MDHIPPPPPPPVPPLPESKEAPELNEVPWRAREGVLIAVLALVSGGFFTLILTALIKPGPGAIGDQERNLLTLCATVIIESALAFWVWTWLRFRHRRGLDALGLRYRRGDVGAGILTAFLGLIAAQIASQIVLNLWEAIRGSPITQPQQLPSDLRGAGQLALAGFAVIVVAPFAEEAFFRGFLYQAFRRWRGVTQGVLISAAVFAISHGAPLLIAGIFPLGIILAYLFERRRSLVATIAAHMTYNLIGFIVLVWVEG